jgi:hypothetical protein
MRNVLIAIAASALVSYCGLVGRPAPLESKLEAAAGQLNEHASKMLPPEFGNSRLESEVIGKDTLVLRILDTPTGHETADPNQLRKILRRDMCEMSSLREIIERGGKIRIEMISNIGVEVTAFQIARC